MKEFERKSTTKPRYDYRYIVFNFNQRDKYVGHKHFVFETDKEAIDFIDEYENNGDGNTVLEIEKSQNDNGMIECEFYKSIWSITC